MGNYMRKLSTNGVDQSFSANMSYKPNIDNPAPGADMSYKPYIDNQPRTVNNKETDQGFRSDMSYSTKNGQGKPRANEVYQSPDMSYKPQVSNAPEAINTEGRVIQTFEADMSYKPTGQTGANMPYDPRIVNTPLSLDPLSLDGKIVNTLLSLDGKIVNKPK